MIYRIVYMMMHKGHDVLETYTYTDEARLSDALRRIHTDPNRKLIRIDASNVDWDSL